MDPERCAPFGLGPGPDPYAAAGDEPPGGQGASASASHLRPAPPRGPRLARFPACGPLEPYLPEPAKPPAKYLQDLGPGPALNGGRFYEGPAEGNAGWSAARRRPAPLPSPPPSLPLPAPARFFLNLVTLPHARTTGPAEAKRPAPPVQAGQKPAAREAATCAFGRGNGRRRSRKGGAAKARGPGAPQGGQSRGGEPCVAEWGWSCHPPRSPDRPGAP